MKNLDDVKIAELSSKDIETIRTLEKKLGSDICLVAVKKKDVLYALEAKLAPNQWKRVDQVYPEITDLKAYYGDYQRAKESKAALKRLLIGHRRHPPLQKRPLRIRQIVSTGDLPGSPVCSSAGRGSRDTKPQALRGETDDAN